MSWRSSALIDPIAFLSSTSCPTTEEGSHDPPATHHSRADRPDIDLDTEVVLLADGTRLTNELAEAIAEDAIARHRGRPSITGASEHTPRMTLRVPERTRHALQEIASRQGRRLADVGREALDEYVRRHAGRAS